MSRTDTWLTPPNIIESTPAVMMVGCFCLGYLVKKFKR